MSTLIITLLISPLLLISTKEAYSQEIGWTRQFGTSAFVSAWRVAVDTSGSVYVVGETRGALPGQSSLGGSDVFVRKYDGSGSELWTRQFGTFFDDFIFGVVVDAYGSVYVAGETLGALPGQSSLGGGDAFVRKYNDSGNEVWTRQFGSSTYDYAEGVAVDASGNVYVAGETLGALPGQSSSGGQDVFVRKYDGSGSELWTRQFGTSALVSVWRVAVDSSGNIYVAGETKGALPGQISSGGWDVFIRKYDGSGSEFWTRQFGTYDNDYAPGMAVDASGNVYAAGYTGGALPGQSSPGGGDAFVRKYDGSGSELWTRQFGSFDYDYAEGVAFDASGNIYVAGLTSGALPEQSSLGGGDAFVRKYDDSGSELWTKQFGSSDYDKAYDVAVDTSNNVYVVGQTYGALPGQTSSGGVDAFLVKFVQPTTADGIALIAPWIILATLIAIAAASVAVYWRKR
ncbi:MAG: SBBP repeat-containing protein [Candidatus Hadarchaeaceae archaeon]